MERFLRKLILTSGVSALGLVIGCADLAEQNAARRAMSLQTATPSSAVFHEAIATGTSTNLAAQSTPATNNPGLLDDAAPDLAGQLSLQPSAPTRVQPLYVAETEPAPEPLEHKEVSLGEDFTKPLRRIDARLEYEDIKNGNDRYIETTRLERPWELSEHWEVGTRLDLPVIEGNDAFSSTKESGYYTGLGDVLTQFALIDKVNSRWRWGVGTQLIFPTATSKEFGDGKYRAVPSAGVRYSLPAISDGSFVAGLVRYDVDYAGRDDRKDISVIEFAPELNIKFPRDFYLDFYPSSDIRYNFLTQKWFVPIDVQIGKRISESWIASVETSWGLIKDYYYYNFKVEFRIGYFY